MNADAGREQTLYGIAYAYPISLGKDAGTQYLPPVIFFTDAIVFGSGFSLPQRLGGDRHREHIWTEMNNKIRALIDSVGVKSVTSDQVLGLLLESLPKSHAVPTSEFIEARMSRKKGWLNPRVDIRLVEKPRKKHLVKLAYPATQQATSSRPRQLITLEYSSVDEIAEGMAAAFGNRFRRD